MWFKEDGQTSGSTLISLTMSILVALRFYIVVYQCCAECLKSCERIQCFGLTGLWDCSFCLFYKILLYYCKYGHPTIPGNAWICFFKFHCWVERFITSSFWLKAFRNLISSMHSSVFVIYAINDEIKNQAPHDWRSEKFPLWRTLRQTWLQQFFDECIKRFKKSAISLKLCRASKLPGVKLLLHRNCINTIAVCLWLGLLHSLLLSWKENIPTIGSIKSYMVYCSPNSADRKFRTGMYKGVAFKEAVIDYKTYFWVQAIQPLFMKDGSWTSWKRFSTDYIKIVKQSWLFWGE